MSLPLVSVAIPAYNHSAFIEECLSSVCAQTYPELELVLIDDGSPDDTFDKAQRFLAQHQDRFRRIVLERRANQGVSGNSNACIEACKGEWVHLLGSDDIIYPTKIEHIQNAIATWQDDSLALVHADCDYIDENGAPVTRSRQKDRPPAGPDRNTSQWLFMGEYYVFNPTVTLHRETFLSIGGFDPTLPLEDLDCWLRLSANHTIARVPETLACYRKHPGNSLRRRVRMLCAQFETYAKFLQLHPDKIQASDLRRHFRQNAWRFWRRVRKQQPSALIPAGLAILKSYFITPTHADYLKFASRLKTICA